MNCNFIQTNLSNLTFNNCQVKKSSFNLASYSRSTIYHSKFNNSEFDNTRMTYLKFSQNYMDDKTLLSFLVGPENLSTQKARQELRTKMDSLKKVKDATHISTKPQMIKA